MSKNISVKVDGVTTTASVDKLRTKMPQSGNTDWIPSEDGGVATLNVYRNGTYNAADMDGIIGFNKVVASVGHGGSAYSIEDIEGASGDKPNVAIKENGKTITMSNVKRIEMDSSGGDTALWVTGSDISMGTKNISSNGTYSAKSDNHDAYSSVTVNVQHGDTLPDEIRITSEPSRTTYANGDTIDYSGLQVKAYKNGSLWTNEYYPNGIIPSRELILPVSTAEFGNIYESSYGNDRVYIYYPSEGRLVSPYVRTNTLYPNYLVRYFGAESAFGVHYIDENNPSNNSVGVICVNVAYQLTKYEIILDDNYYANERLIVKENNNIINRYWTFGLGFTDENRGKTVNYNYKYAEFTDDKNPIVLVDSPYIDMGKKLPLNKVTMNDPYTMSLYNVGYIAWIAKYGNRSDDPVIRAPVQWNRPSDGMILQDDFTIYMSTSQ